MKIMTILGTRPEIIRLCEIIKKIDCFANNILVHTGQNYDKNLHHIFFQDLNLRYPDIQLNANPKISKNKLRKLFKRQVT